MNHGPMLTKAEAEAVRLTDPRCFCGYRFSAHDDTPCGFGSFRFSPLLNDRDVPFMEAVKGSA